MCNHLYSEVVEKETRINRIVKKVVIKEVCNLCGKEHHTVHYVYDEVRNLPSFYCSMEKG